VYTAVEQTQDALVNQNSHSNYLAYG